MGQAGPPPSDGLAVGVDVGGTKTMAGLVAGDGRILRRLRRDTPAHDPDGIVRLVADVVGELRGEPEAGGAPVGVGAAGMVDLVGVMRYAPNLDWRDFPLRAGLVKLLGDDVWVENDANVAAWGEFRAGAGVDARSSMLMLTVGTGVGSGLVLGGQLVRGRGGLATEFGHLIVAEGARRCGCGNLGCLEAMASGTAIGRMAQESLDSGEVPADSLLQRSGAPTGRSVTRAAEAGDAFASEVLARCGFWLGVGIASLVAGLDPEIVVVGGGVIETGERLLEPARRAYAPRVMGHDHRDLPAVVEARLGDDAGLVGAALIALDERRRGQSAL
ncbi:MAG: ROK family protein [Actinomycetota bacterium]|nr:ROK family protein [Actinomycetota bacterium]